MHRNLEKKDSHLIKLILFNLKNSVSIKLDNFIKYRDAGN